MTTIPGKFNFYLIVGATFDHIITWKDQSGNLIDLTSCTARMQMRETVDALLPFLTLTTDNGGITLGGTDGTISLLGTSAMTSGIQATQGVYDLEIIAPDGITVTRLLEGIVFIDQEVTR